MSRQRYIKAVTIWPEWVFAILYLGKDVENREGWPFGLLASMVGTWIAIHGGKNIAGKPLLKGGQLSVHHKNAIKEVLLAERYLRERVAEPPSRLNAPITANSILDEARGIVALARVGGLRIGQPRGWFAGAPAVGIEIAELVRLERPVPCDGAQMLWTVDAGLVRQVQQVLPPSAPESVARIISEAT